MSLEKAISVILESRLEDSKKSNEQNQTGYCHNSKHFFTGFLKKTAHSRFAKNCGCRYVICLYGLDEKFCCKQCEVENERTQSNNPRS